MAISLVPARRLDPCWGSANRSGCGSFFASPLKAASTSAGVMPQRASRQTGGGVGSGVGVAVSVVVVGGRVVVTVVDGGGGGSAFFVHDADRTGTATASASVRVLMDPPRRCVCREVTPDAPRTRRAAR